MGMRVSTRPRIDRRKSTSIPHLEKDVVLIVGQNSVGKTTAFRYLTQFAQRQGIQYEADPVSDFFFLLNQTLKDDETGGFCHYHDWSEGRGCGHSHDHGEAKIPFVITHNELVDGMHDDFLNTITHLPRSGKLWFVEWTGGVNTNPLGKPVSQVDFSFDRIVKKLHEGCLPFEWIERVHAIIHISAEKATRYIFNVKDTKHQPLEIFSGQVSARRVETVLELFGRDDFSSIEPMFNETRIKYIFDVYNKGDEQFYANLETIGELIFY